MSKYIVKRILFAILALFILMSIVFFLMAVLPNAPITKTNKETIEEYNAKLASIGWFDPVIVRYFKYWATFFGINNSGGAFGQVFNKEGTTLVQYFFQNIPNTFYIASVSYVLAIFLGFTFGIIAAVYRGKWQDTFINVISVILISVPSFIIGILLLKLAGAIGLPQNFMNFDSDNFTVAQFIASSIMPVLALTFGLASTLTYYVRNELVEVLSQDYIKTAMSKGLTKRQIIFNHGLRNSLIPPLSVLGPSFLFVITGSIVIESIFGVKGIASLVYDAILNNQFYVIMFQTFFVSGIYFIITLLLDISFTIIDPRIKLAESSQTSIYNYAKTTINRITWKKHWVNAKGNPEYKWVSGEESLYRSLLESKSIDYKKKIVSLDQNIINSYSIDQTAKFLVIGKDILKIKYSNNQNLENQGKE